MKLKDTKMLSDDPENFDPDSLIPRKVRSKWVAQLRNESSSANSNGVITGLLLGGIMFSFFSNDDDASFTEVNFIWILMGCLVLLAVNDWVLRSRRKKLSAELFRAVSESGETDGMTDEV